MKVEILPKKLIVQLFTIAMIWAGFALPVNADSLSKNLKDTKVFLEINQGKIIDIMSEITDRTDYVFIYENGVKKELNKKVTISNTESLHSILVDIAMQSDLEFRAVNNNIVVRKKTEQGKEAVEYVQSITVTGRVISQEDEEGIPGVNVVIKGTTQGTVTDINGNFKIDVPDASAVLVFSSVGFVTQEIPVGNQSEIFVNMAPDVKALQEVVVTALGIERNEASLGYSVGKVEGDQLTHVVQENVLNGLAAKIPGVTINSTSGPGSSVSMVIRGASSLTSDNQPLFVVDGVPMNNTLNNVTQMADRAPVDYGNAISDINPEDIESISVLKGPSAAALYGSRAGNGVVLITTKSGKKSKGVGVSITSNTVFDKPYKYLGIHNWFANGKRPYTQDNRPNNGLDYYSVPAGDSYWVGPELDKGMMAYQWPYFNESGELEARPLVSHPDNPKEFFKTGFTTTNGIALSNSSEKVTYRLSFNNMMSQGVIPNSDLHRNTISLNSTFNILKNLQLSSSINYSNTGADNRPAGNRGANPMNALYNVNSFIDINDLKNYWWPGKEGFQQNGPYNLVVNSDGTYGVNDMQNNPYFLAYQVNNPFNRERIYGNMKLNWQFAKDFSAFIRYNLDQYTETRETKIAPSYSKEPNGFYGIVDLFRREQNADFLVTYKKVTNDWDISASVGGNWRFDYYSHLQTQAKRRGSGLVVPGIYSISNIAQDNLLYYSGYSEKLVYSLYGLVSVGFKNAIYLDLTGRNDWSSTLPEDNRSYFYPSASLSVLLDEVIDFGKSVSLFKLRGGWAQVGNDTSPYRLLSTMYNAGNWGNQTRLGTSGTILLPDLKPEIQTSWEVGTDLAFFQNRLRFEITYYQADNRNQILNIGLPPSSGWSSKQINAGLLESKGVEIGLGGTPVSTSDWNWDINFNFSKNKTIIKELYEGFDYIRLWSDAKGGAYSWVGDPVGQMIDRAMVRVKDPTSPYYGWPIIDDEGWEDSDRTLQDENGNRVAPVIGNFNPDFIIGTQTTLSFKRFVLNMSIDWRKGGQFVSQTLRYGESDLHTERWFNKVHNFSNIDNIPQYLKDHADEYLLPGGEFFVLIGGPTEERGGFEFTEDGITLHDGVFMPGVVGHYEDDKFVMERENLGDENTPLIRIQDYYGWSYTRTATFDADFIKLREVSLGYTFPNIKGIQNLFVSLYSRNIILWTKAGIAVDPELAFQPEGGTQPSGIQFKQGIERYNVAPWTFPIGIKLNITF